MLEVSADKLFGSSYNVAKVLSCMFLFGFFICLVSKKRTQTHQEIRTWGKKKCVLNQTMNDEAKIECEKIYC